MPFKSQAQRRYLYRNNPRLAQQFERETPPGAALPEKGTPKKDTTQPGKEGEVETQVPPSEVEQERNRLRRQVRNPKTRGLDRRTALVNYINTVKTKGKIAARTANWIKQANVLNLNNPVTVDRFINRVDKSFQKAESTAQIQKAERLRKQIQKKSKSKTIDGRVTVAAKSLEE